MQNNGPFERAKALPKGTTVEEDTQLRVMLLNLILMGGMKRDETSRRTSEIVGLNDDRPKKLIQYIKGGGGSASQLQEAIQFHLALHESS